MPGTLRCSKAECRPTPRGLRRPRSPRVSRDGAPRCAMREPQANLIASRAGAFRPTPSLRKPAVGWSRAPRSGRAEGTRASGAPGALSSRPPAGRRWSMDPRRRSRRDARPRGPRRRVPEDDRLTLRDGDTPHRRRGRSERGTGCRVARRRRGAGLGNATFRDVKQVARTLHHLLAESGLRVLLTGIQSRNLWVPRRRRPGRRGPMARG